MTSALSWHSTALSAPPPTTCTTSLGYRCSPVLSRRRPWGTFWFSFAQAAYWARVRRCVRVSVGRSHRSPTSLPGFRPTTSASCLSSAVMTVSVSVHNDGDLGAIESAIAGLQVEIPSWGFGDSGTRFATFPQPARPRNVFERIDDDAQVNALTGAAGVVALHFPW